MALTAPRGFAGGPMADIDYGFAINAGAFVEGSGALAVSQPNTATRTVSIASGTADVFGIRVSNDSVVDQALAAPGSGGAWYLLVLRFNWSSKTCSIVVHAGSSTGSTTTPTAVPVALPAAYGSTPGGTFDFPLAWVFVSSATTTVAIFDVRLITDGLLGSVSAATVHSLVTLQLVTTITAGAQLNVRSSSVTHRWSGSKWCPWNSPWQSFNPTIDNFTLGGAGAANQGTWRWEDGRVRVRTWTRFGAGGAINGVLALAVPEPVNFTADTITAPLLDGHVVVRNSSRTYRGPVSTFGDNVSKVTLAAHQTDLSFLYVAAMAAGQPIAAEQYASIWTDFAYESANYPFT